MNGFIKKRGRHRFFVLTGFLGLLFVLWGSFVYARTFIPVWQLLCGTLLFALLASWASLRYFLVSYRTGRGWGLFLAFLWNVIGPGCGLAALFLISNYYLAKGPVVRKEFSIISRTTLPGTKGQRGLERPVFTISYKGHEKELVFVHRFYKWKDDYKSVILTLQPGYWGYEVIKGKAVTK